jgi:hypothetical protein
MAERCWLRSRVFESEFLNRETLPSKVCQSPISPQHMWHKTIQSYCTGSLRSYLVGMQRLALSRSVLAPWIVIEALIQQDPSSTLGVTNSFGLVFS